MVLKELTKREQESAAKKKQISDTAIELFRAYGYEKTTIADISRSSGMSSGSIYHYFGSKDSILAYALRELGELTLPSEHWNREDAQPYDVIMEFLLYNAERWQSVGPELAPHMAKPFAENYFGADGHYLSSLQGISDLTNYIARCQANGSFKTDVSAEDAANYLMLVGRSLVTDWCYYYSQQIDLRKRVTEIMPRIVRSFLTDSGE